MKKISLKDVKNGLKRDEMRAIVGGGCGGDSGSKYKCCLSAGSGCSECVTSWSGATCSYGSLYAC